MKNLVAGSRGGLAPARRRPANRGATRVLSVMLLFAAALSAPGLAYAAPWVAGRRFPRWRGRRFPRWRRRFPRRRHWRFACWRLSRGRRSQ